MTVPECGETSVILLRLGEYKQIQLLAQDRYWPESMRWKEHKRGLGVFSHDATFPDRSWISLTLQGLLKRELKRVRTAYRKGYVEDRKQPTDCEYRSNEKRANMTGADVFFFAGKE